MIKEKIVHDFMNKGTDVKIKFSREIRTFWLRPPEIRQAGAGRIPKLRKDGEYYGKSK